MRPRRASEKKGGRKSASLNEPQLVEALHEIVEVHTAGSPVEPLRLWTNRSPRELADELQEQGFTVCANTVQRLLVEELHLAHRSIVKTLPLGAAAGRDEQFHNIAKLKEEYFLEGWPVISIDTKKQELLGKFSRRGQAWTNGTTRAWDHDFPTMATGKVIPYGVYDVTLNQGFMLLGSGADTAELACDAIRRWWFLRGVHFYEEPGSLLVLADSGGSNGRRVGLFREGLCKLAARLGFPIRVAHLPPYCSKYNPIDHRLFCHLTRSLQGLLCRTVDTIRDAFARTVTATGLDVVVEVARKVYAAGVKASQEFLRDEPIIRDNILPQWNYVAPAF